jgi:hypothetical protein
MESPVTEARLNPSKKILATLVTGFFFLFLASLSDLDLTQALFLRASYYLFLGSVLCWLGLYAHKLHTQDWPSLRSWCWDNWPGLLIAGLVTPVAALSLDPGLLVLSDEANLVGTSKNLYFLKSPTLTLSGKSYYGSYWNVDTLIDQRPALFPFLVSLLHAALGYSHENAFYLNLTLLPWFILLSYRLAKTLAGEAAGILAALFVVAHPIVLISVRSGGFDFIATVFSVLVIKTLLDFLRSKSAEDLALLWMNLCMLSGLRYESALFLAPVLGLLSFFRLVRREQLAPYALFYAISPAFLLPRIWLSLLRGSVPKQAPGTVTFSLENFGSNAHEYLRPLLDPMGNYPAHSTILMGLGVIALGRWLWLRPDREGRKTKKPSAERTRFALFVGAFMVLQVVIVFTYVWGRAQYPSAARLVLPIDVFLSFLAAWVVARTTRPWPPLVAGLIGAGLLLTQLPKAADNKLMGELTETREYAALWRFFRRIPTDDVLVVSRRPHHFTIMNYGAMSFEVAKKDQFLFTALDRRLFREIYIVQQIQISTNAPLPGYEYWSERKLSPVFSFQNEADVLIRVSRVNH